LQSFPADTLKIDRSFINDMAISKERTEIVRTIVELAHNLGLNTVAEGVETLDQVARLVSFECETAQGFMFGRPAAPDEVALLLHDGLDMQAFGE
jgi:EAL domain-containing protein (putative c-di-GMP-specific phosphodiesterase class I)